MTCNQEKINDLSKIRNDKHNGISSQEFKNSYECLHMLKYLNKNISRIRKLMIFK